MALRVYNTQKTIALKKFIQGKEQGLHLITGTKRAGLQYIKDEVLYSYLKKQNTQNKLLRISTAETGNCALHALQICEYTLLGSEQHTSNANWRERLYQLQRKYLGDEANVLLREPHELDVDEVLALWANHMKDFNLIVMNKINIKNKNKKSEFYENAKVQINKVSAPFVLLYRNNSNKQLHYELFCRYATEQKDVIYTWFDEVDKSTLKNLSTCLKEPYHGYWMIDNSLEECDTHKAKKEPVFLFPSGASSSSPFSSSSSSAALDSTTKQAPKKAPPQKQPAKKAPPSKAPPKQKPSKKATSKQIIIISDSDVDDDGDSKTVCDDCFICKMTLEWIPCPVSLCRTSWDTKESCEQHMSKQHKDTEERCDSTKYYCNKCGASFHGLCLGAWNRLLALENKSFKCVNNCAGSAIVAI
jgi:hypothetical protein